MPVELDGAERVVGSSDYNIDALKAGRPYFPKEPRTNVDKCSVPGDLWDRVWQFAEGRFGEAVAASLAGDRAKRVAAPFFVLHDTSVTTEYGVGTGLRDPGTKGSTAGIHLWISAKATYQQRDWSTPGYGTKLDSGAPNYNFLHVELSRDPKLKDGATFYNQSQYERLACAYLFASARRGKFITLTAHCEVDRACCIYDDAKGKFVDYGHHDPERFDLALWYRIVASAAGLPADATFGIEPSRVDGTNRGGQKNVFIDYVKGTVDEVDQFGPIAWISAANTDAKRHKKVRHPSYGEYYDLPVTIRLAAGGRVLPRDA
jgi:hypothetical protein